MRERERERESERERERESEKEREREREREVHLIGRARTPHTPHVQPVRQPYAHHVT